MTKSKSIICDNVTVEFQLFNQKARSIRAKITNSGEQANFFRALEDVSFTMNHGERVGLLGKNGSGKTTFLRTLAGVYVPQNGSVAVKGGITSLLDVKVGVDSDATGYENIPLLMAARGIPLEQFDQVKEDVEEFSELGEALNRPLRTYSAGMRLRIAFAIATYAVTGNLLMDEVVGVGDAAFRAKSKQRNEKLLANAPSIVLASHSEAWLKSYCERGIIFERGKIIFDGTVDEAIAEQKREDKK